MAKNDGALNLKLSNPSLNLNFEDENLDEVGHVSPTTAGPNYQDTSNNPKLIIQKNSVVGSPLPQSAAAAGTPGTNGQLAQPYIPQSPIKVSATIKRLPGMSSPMTKNNTFAIEKDITDRSRASSSANTLSNARNDDVIQARPVFTGSHNTKGLKKFGNTKLVMALLSELWIFNIIFICGMTYYFTFVASYQNYLDDELWNISCYWKIGWLLPLPYTMICFISLALPFRTPKFLHRDPKTARRIDNLYILTVTKGDNKEAVMRAWNCHKDLEQLDPCVRVHVLTDEPNFFDNINCFTCPKAFSTKNSKYKARALEWYRLTMKYTEYDWILHLDEESVIDYDSVIAALDFIRYEKDCHWGQGVILYNQHKYWSNWIFTVADAIRVGDDLARFHLQYTYFRRPIFGAHGSFLLTNGVVENTITWDLGSLTEDYQFATHAWELGFRCGKIAGLVREQSPFDLMSFLKQRRRWFVGIRRLPDFLPKLWWFFWTLGTFSLYFTIISVILGFVLNLQTPRWFGLLKDLSFVNFVYLYLLGIFIQDIDAGKNPLIVLIHIPMTIIIQFAAVVMEAMAVMYGLLFPPTDFDVIKK